MGKDNGLLSNIFLDYTFPSVCHMHIYFLGAILYNESVNSEITTEKSLCLRARRFIIRPALISGFISMKRLGVFLLPPGWDASPSQGYPQHFAGTHLYTWLERGTVRV